LKTKILSSLQKVITTVKSTKKTGLEVGLVTGGFDVLHMGHLNLFRLAKKHSDILVVGLDHDKTLRATKGENRPINNYKRRSQFLSDLSTVDYIFKINKVFKHGDDKSTAYFESLYKKINPTYVFTHTATDSLSKRRKQLAKQTGITFIPDRSKTVTHSTTIIKKLELEFWKANLHKHIGTLYNKFQHS